MGINSRIINTFYNLFTINKFTIYIVNLLIVKNYKMYV